MINEKFFPLGPVVRAAIATAAMLFLVGDNAENRLLLHILFFAGFFAVFSRDDRKMLRSKFRGAIPAAVLALWVILPGVSFAGIAARTLVSALLHGGCLWFLLAQLLNWLYGKTPEGREAGTEKGKTGQLFCLSFSLLWVSCLLLFLNQYPGSLSCDTTDQLAQALGLRPFENANPFFHTLFLTMCIRLGLAVFGDINAAVAVYTVAQFTMVCAAFAFCVVTIFRKTGSRLLLVFSQLFFNALPLNLVYATGMWKDTFFAALFLMTMTYGWDLLTRERVSRDSWVWLSLLALATALARNSGWSSLLVWGIVLVLRSGKQGIQWRKAGQAILFGSLAAVVVMLVVYPALGIRDNGPATTALSVPLQQVARVVARGGEIGQEDLQLIQEAVDVQALAECYDETISDPVKRIVDETVLMQRMGEFGRLWLRLGIQNPGIYLDAYLKQMQGYWDLNNMDWVWDHRIFENQFGVERTPLLLGNVDLTALFLSIPKMYLIQRKGIVLWMVVVLLGCAVEKKNALAEAMFAPMLMIYAGLFLTSPAALFRYIYPVTVCIPLLLALPRVTGRKEI